MFTKKIIILLLVIFLISCSKNENNKSNIVVYSNKNKATNKNFNIKLKKAFSISKSNNSKDSLTYLYNIFIKNDKIYISDFLLSKIFVYNSKNGNYLFSFGGKGNGPGEFQNLSTMGLYKDTIIVSDVVARKINKFTLNGEFIKAKLNIANAPTDLHNFNEKYFIATNLHGSTDRKHVENSITIYNPNLSKVKVLQNYSIPIKRDEDSTTINLSKITPVFATSDKYLYVPVIDEYKYLIRKYDENLKEIAQIRKNYIAKKLSYEQKKDIARNAGYKNKIIDKYQRSIWGIYNDKDNRLWVLSAYNQKEKEIKFDIFENGKYLNTINFPYYENLLTLVKTTSNIHFVKDYIVINKDKEVEFYRYD